MQTREQARENEGSGTLAEAAKGALAGAVGVWALDQVSWAMWNRTDPEHLRQEVEARPGGLDPAHVMANRAAETMGMTLAPSQPHPAGIAVHYALGVLPGAAYGVLRHQHPTLTLGSGMLYGLGLFLIEDEGLNPLMGTSGAPTEYPAEAHLRGLLGHLVLGAATHATLKLLDRVM